MTALNNLAAFVYKLPDELQPEFMNLVDAVTDERDRLQNERIATSQATTGKYEVVAVAGTAETLLNDVSYTNVGEINVGDTVELNPNVRQSAINTEYLYKDRCNVKSLNTVTDKFEFIEGVSIRINNSIYWHPLRLFRKVSTPIVNNLNSAEGC